MDGITVVDGVMMDTNLRAVTVDGNMAVDLATLVDSVMTGMVVADTTSPIQDTAKRITAADRRTGHRISPTQSCSMTFDVHASART
jgi:hypothetical protein